MGVGAFVAIELRRSRSPLPRPLYPGLRAPGQQYSAETRQAVQGCVHGWWRVAHMAQDPALIA